MAVGVRISKLNFSDGKEVDCSQANVIVIVGPNNAGKSRSLSDLFNHVIHPGGRYSSSVGTAIRSISIFRFGSGDDFWDCLKKFGYKFDQNEKLAVQPNPNMGGNAISYTDRDHWPKTLDGQWNRFFVDILRASGRDQLANPAPSIQPGRESYTSPLQVLRNDLDFRKKISDLCEKAFGLEFGLDMLGGQQIVLHVGKGAAPEEGESPISPAYRDRVNELPKLSEQGDGIKSFVGLSIHSLLSHKTVVMIDEPEAFLHPPQARLLSKFLSEELPRNGQLFMATHSVDILVGALEANGAAVQVIRLRRDGNVNFVKALSVDEIREIWADPVLRYSNILNGLFHEKVVVCEADGDCRFYNALADALRIDNRHPYLRDILFTPAGGKAGIPKIVRALRGLAVPVCAIVDFDLLRDAGQLRSLLAAFDLDFDDFRGDYEIVRDEINSLGIRTPSQIKEFLIAEANKIDDASEQIDRSISKAIREALIPAVGWSRAKRTGLGLLRPGQAAAAGDRLLGALSNGGVFIVPDGEMESFVRNETADKNDWVRNVLERNAGKIDTSDELEAARAFTAKLISS
jgi:hypothetical protein